VREEFPTGNIHPYAKSNATTARRKTRSCSRTTCRVNWKRGWPNSSTSTDPALPREPRQSHPSRYLVRARTNHSHTEAKHQTQGHRVTAAAASASGRLNPNPMAHRSLISKRPLSQLFRRRTLRDRLVHLRSLLMNSGNEMPKRRGPSSFEPAPHLTSWQSYFLTFAFVAGAADP
jgi:hypothetical protein